MLFIDHNPPTLQKLRTAADLTGLSTSWYELGLQLLQEHNNGSVLSEIEHDNPNNAKKCCVKMFEKWLNQQPNASWDQLLTALKEIKMNSAAEQIKGKMYSIITQVASQLKSEELHTMYTVYSP